ncbi:multiubiquitin domain-containing protein [Mucilaginibacter sp. SP1R1]|uniref:multiubiquitin domain-containing protein n=1 Tax=Mucilaginibacter sp. SP1R1 TaxID=2723091 RepID=UPI001606FB4B|nr:multiubiquitin domain-containing protein [Mucilaginibacter sp. SP1R1]MBB6149587.1 hypothetical protein [Mucilaginibacter sp. SP1R1]
MNNPENAGHESAQNKLPLRIEGKEFQWAHQYITGLQVKELIGAAAEVKVFLAIEKPWEDEHVADDDRVDLARPGIEQFYLKYVLFLTIEGRNYEWGKQYITGKELRELANLGAVGELFLSITKPWEDELIGDDTKVDLARPGIEHFYLKAAHVPPKVTIIVDHNDREIEPGERAVAEIKKVGMVTKGYELDQLINGSLIPLKDDGTVCIKGGEEFLSRVKDGTSS